MKYKGFEIWAEVSTLHSLNEKGNVEGVGTEQTVMGYYWRDPQGGLASDNFHDIAAVQQDIDALTRAVRPVAEATS